MQGGQGQIDATNPDGLFSLTEISPNNADIETDDPTDPPTIAFFMRLSRLCEVLNIYSGNATADEPGLATVAPPDRLEAENTDFRHELTTIGRGAHAARGWSLVLRFADSESETTFRIDLLAQRE